jgi:hypothetical protein
MPLANPVTLPNLRTVRLKTDAAHADAQIEGTAAWRRSEPGDDPALQAAINADVINWVRTCARS